MMSFHKLRWHIFKIRINTAERQKTFETIKTKTNIDLSINENINENLKLPIHLAP